MVQSIQRHILDNPQSFYDYLRKQEQLVTNLQREVDTLRSRPANQVATTSAMTPSGLEWIRQSLELGGKVPLNVTGLIGRLNEAQDARIPRVSTHPDPLTVTYDLYILTGSPDTLWGINRDVNPPTRFQIIVVTNEFADNVWRVYDEVDTTKKVSFDVGTLVATGQVRVMTIPNNNQILAGRNFDNAFSTLETFVLGITVSGGVVLISATAAANTKMLNLDPGLGGSVFSVDVEGDVIANTGTFGGAITAAGATISGSPTSIAGGLSLRVLSVTTTPVTITASDIFVYVNTGAARTINLPPTPSAGEVHIVKDDAGTGAATNNITVSGNGKNIDGAASHTINTDRGRFIYIYNSAQWSVI